MKPKEKLLFSFLCGILIQLPEVEVVLERRILLWMESAMVEEGPIIADDSQRSTHTYPGSKDCPENMSHLANFCLE